MPYIEVKVAGELTPDQKREIVKEITATMEKVAGKPPESTYVVIQNMGRDNWAKSGKLLDD